MSSKFATAKNIKKRPRANLKDLLYSTKRRHQRCRQHACPGKIGILPPLLVKIPNDSDGEFYTVTAHPCNVCGALFRSGPQFKSVLNNDGHCLFLIKGKIIARDPNDKKPKPIFANEE